MVFNNINDLIKYLTENGEQGVLDVLSGQDLIGLARDLSKNWTEEQRKNMETLAKRTSESGNAAQDQIEEIEKIAKKLGASIAFDYDDKRKEITLRIIRDKDVEGDKNVTDKNSITPIKIKLEVGSSKVGYKDGVPAIKNPSFSRYDDQSMLTTALEDVLINVKRELASAANTKGRSISTKKLKGRIGSVVSKASTGITANSGRASVIRKDLSEDMMASGSIDNAEILKETAKYGNIAYSVASDVVKKIGRPSNKKGFEIDEDRMARDVYLYIMANQAKLFDKKEDNKDFAANILRERGYTDEHIKLMAELIGEEVLSMPSAINLGSDRSAATLTGVLSQAGDIFLENYGRSDRHSTQGRKTIKKLHKSKKNGKYRDVEIFRNEKYDKDGHYERAEKELYTSAEIDSKKFLEKYIKIRKKAEESIRKKLKEEYKKKNKNIESEAFEKEVTNRLRSAGFSDIIPSLDDDMMITSNSVLKGLKGTQSRSLQITKEEYDHWAKEAMDKVEKSGSSTISFGGRKFNTKKNKRKQDYINAYIASKIKGINPKEIYNGKVESVNLGENDNGEEIIGLAFDQLVSPTQQGKVLTGGIGQRNYAFAIQDELFANILKELGLEGEGVDFLRKKENIKSNDALQKALAIITNKYKKSENKEGFLKNLKNSPLGSLISDSINSDGSIYFDPSNEGLKKFAEEGGVTKLYEWMSDNGIYNANDDAIIYDTTANLIDTYAWTKRVQTGQKERDAQERTSYVSKSTDEYRKRIKERYSPLNYRDKEIQEKAKHDQEEIRKAIMSKTASTGKQSEDEIKKYLSGSYTKGYKGTDKKVISIGSGEGYSLNLDNYIDTILKYQRGHITEEEFAKTWQHDIEELKKEMIASGIKEEDIDIAIDPGTKFGFSSNGKQFKGRLLHLGNIKPTESTDPITGETVYDMPEYTSSINSLFGAIAGDKSDEKSWKNKVSQASVEAIREMNSLAFYNKGAIFERANKLRLGHSKSFKASGINTDQIDSLLEAGKTDEAEKLISNAFVSKNAMAEMLLDTHDYETKDSDGNIVLDLEGYKKKLYAQYKNSNLYEKEKLSIDEIFEGKTDLKSIQDAILPKLLNIAKTEGLRGMFNRFPSIDSEAVKNARLFVSDSIKQDDIMQIGAGLQKAINADFDGDTINIILKMLEDYQGDNTEDWDKKIALNLYKKYSERKKEEENKVFEEYAKNNGIKGPLSEEDKEKAIKINKEQELKNTLGSADDEYLKRLSGFASKVNNQFIGSLSNMSTAIRGSIYNTKYDETGIKRDKNGNITETSFLDVSKGYLTKALGQTLEQDAISSKKVEKRIAKTFEEEVEKINKEKEANGEDDFITVEDFAKDSKYEERRKEIATRIINDYNKLVESIYSGDFKNDEEFFDKLKEFGITSNGKFDSLAMSTAVSQIEELSKELNISDEEKNKLFEKIFGQDYTSVLKTGFVGVDAVKNSMGDVANGLFKGKNGFFWAGDTYNPAAVASRKNNTGTKDDTAEIIRVMKDSGYIGNLEKIEENNDLFDEHGRILRDVSEAYDEEIGKEKLKTVIAKEEGEAIKKLTDRYNGLSTTLSKIAKQKDGKPISDITSEDVKEEYKWVPGLKKPISISQLRNNLFSLEDKVHYPESPKISNEKYEEALKEGKKRPLTEERLGEILGLRGPQDLKSLTSTYGVFNKGSFVGNTSQLMAELEKAGVDEKIIKRAENENLEDYIKRLADLGLHVANDTTGKYNLTEETRNVIRSYSDPQNLDEHNEHSDIVTLFQKLKDAEVLFGNVDDSFKTENIFALSESIFEIMKKLKMTGENLIGTEVGSTAIVGNQPIATTADVMSTQDVDKDGKKYKQLVITDIKTHANDKYSREDAAQVLTEEYGMRELIAELSKDNSAFNKDEKTFVEIQRQILTERYRKQGLDDAAINKILNGIPILTKEAAMGLVETFKAGIDPVISRIIVGNKQTGEATSYDFSGANKKDLLDLIFKATNNGPLSIAEGDLFEKAGGFSATTSEYKKPEEKEPEAKTKVQKEYLDLLKKEFLIKKEIEELKKKQAFSTDQDDIESYQKQIDDLNRRAKLIKSEIKKTGKLIDGKGSGSFKRGSKEYYEGKLDVLSLSDDELRNKVKEERVSKYKSILDEEFKLKKARSDMQANLDLTYNDDDRKLYEDRINALNLRIKEMEAKRTSISWEGDSKDGIKETLLKDKEAALGLESYTDEEIQNSAKKKYIDLLNKEYKIKEAIINLNNSIKLSESGSDEERYLLLEKKKLEEEAKKIESERKRSGTVITGTGSRTFKNEEVERRENKLKLIHQLTDEEAATQKEEAAQSELNKALKNEYDIRLKIAELRAKKELSTDEKEKENIDKIISYESLNLTKAEEARKAAEDKVTDKDYKNNVLSAEEAKYQLGLQKLAERLTKGAGDIAGKKGLFSDFGKQLKGYFVNMFSVYRIIGKITQELRKCVQIAKELDKSATNIRIVTGMSSKEVDGLMKKYTGLARELGVTTQVVAQAGQEWMRQGYSAEQANDLIISSTKLSKLGMMDMNNATKVLTSTMKGFKLEASEVSQVVDKLTKLDMNYATTAADIGEAMSRTAAIANQMGVSLDETAAMVTTIMDITQQSAEMTGTAIRTILSRYGNVKSGSFVSMLTDGEDLDKINDIEKVLSVLGIEIRKSGLEMRDVGDVLDELALKWTTLSDVEKNAVATAFAGTRQRNQFIVLMDNWKQVEEATDMAANAAGTADEKYGAVMDSIEARLDKLQTAWEEFTQKLGTSSFVKGAVSALTFLVENLDKILTLLGSISVYLMAKKLWANVGKLGGIFNGLSTIGFKKGAADAAANPNGGIINRIFGTTQKGFTTVSSKLDQIMAIMRGEQTGDTAMNVVDSMTVGDRSALYKQNKDAIKQNNAEIKKLNKLMKEHKAPTEFDPRVGYKNYYRLQNDEIKAQNAALKGKGFDVGNGKIITMRKGPDGNMMYYATTMQNGKPQTKEIDSNSADAQNAKAQKKAQTGQKLAGAAAMGLMAGATFDTNTMNDTGAALGFSYGKGGTTIDDVESTKTEDFLYKTSHGIGSAALSMIPGIGPILSAVVGPILSDLFHGLIKWAVHSEEINRKERVRIAKENLEALKKIEDATAGVESAIFNINSAEAIASAKESVDKLISTLLDDSKNRDKIMNELGSKFGFAVDELGNTTMTMADLENILLYGTDEEKIIATNTINEITSSESVTEKYKSQEEDRVKAAEKITAAKKETTDSINTGENTVDTSTKGAIMDSLGVYSKVRLEHEDDEGNTTYETRRTIVGNSNKEIEKNINTAILKMQEIVEAGVFNGKELTENEIAAINKEIESLERATKTTSEYNAQTEKLNRELHGLELRDAFRSSGLSMWNAVDIANTSLETVIQTFANNLILTGIETRDATGMITEEARQQIETYLRSNEQFSSLFNNGTQTLNEMISNISKQNELVSKTGAKSFDELKDAFDRADAKKIEEFSNAAGIAAEELMGLVYKSDSSQLSSFARALNMTTEDVLALQNKLGSITLSDLIKTPAETREAFNELAGIFSEISIKGSATGETLEKLNSNYFNLYNKYDDLGNVISTGSENLLENLRERLFGDAGSSGTQAFLYQNATFQDFKNNSDMYKSYLANLKNSDVWHNLSDDQRAAFTGANSLTDVIHLFNSSSANGEALQNTLSGFLDSLNLSNDYYTELQNKLVEWQKHDNQTIIDGLQSQIDALDEINEERQKEIELIKAKDALENAKKEKKRVYRAGIGWTYEANQEKISEAKDKLDEIEGEIDKENLQYQIDLLEKQNSMLDNMAKNEELKALRAVFDEYNTYMKNKFGKEITSGFSEIIDLAESDRTMTWSTYVENMGTEQAVGEQIDITNMTNQANDIAYLDSVLSEMLKDAGLTDINKDGVINELDYDDMPKKEKGKHEKVLKTLHSDEYISRQTARKNAYNSFVGSVSNLKASGATDETINQYLQSGLDSKYQNNSNYNSTSSYTATKYDKAINDKYYYLKFGFGESSKNQGVGQADVTEYKEENQYLRLKPTKTFKSDQLSKGLNIMKEHPDKVRVDYYDNNLKKWVTMPDDESAINALPNGTIVHIGSDYQDKTSDEAHGYAIKSGAGWDELESKVVKYASGTFGVDKAVMAMINELGTEGIVTPQGTLTALPSKTGIVPADLTKNLYNLGEVAPNLIKKLGDNQILQTKNLSNLEDNSMSVENLYATFETDNNFDFEKLLISARQYIKNTKGTK